MAALSIRNLDESVKNKIRLRAAHNGRSMEAEVRAILIRCAEEPLEEISEKKQGNLGQRIHSIFQKAGGLELPDRQEEPARYVDFDA